jgi:hypothetical protein
MSDLRTDLERAADHVRPSDDAFEDLARHRRRRQRSRRIGTAALALVVAAAGIGVAVVALGGHERGPDRLASPPPPSESPSQTTGAPPVETYDDPVGWSISYPDGWTLDHFNENDIRIGFTGIAISNFGAAGGVQDTSFLRDFPEDGVVIEVFYREGGPPSIGTLPDDRFPLSFTDLERNERTASPVPGVETYQKDFVGNSFQSTIVVWAGRSISSADRDAMRSVVSSLAFRPLTEGTVIRREFAFYVLRTPDDYPVGSVTRFDESNLPAADIAERGFAFYLVRTEKGFYAVSWPNDFTNDYTNCDVTFDEAMRRFTCPNGAVWALDGSVITNPDPSRYRDDALAVLLVRISLDGHVLVSPNTYMNTNDGLRTDYELTGSA